jgi:nucleotide-binding universal stress UspA family protein
MADQMGKNLECKLQSAGEVQTSQFEGEKSFPDIGTIRRIMVPTELTKESEEAIKFGVQLARVYGAHLTLLHVYQEPYYTIEYVLGPEPCEPAQNERMCCRNALEWMVENIKKEYADCSFEFREGVPCEEIVCAAKDLNIDLVILSTHDYNWLTRLALGCDAEWIIHNAPCPILVLKANVVTF